MPTTGPLNGTAHALYIDVSGTLKKVAHLKSNDFDLSNDLIEITSKSSVDHKEFIYGWGTSKFEFAGRYSHTAPVAGEHAQDLILTAALNKTTVIVVSTTNVSGDKKITSTCLISNVKISSPDNDSCDFTCSLQSTGKPVIGTIA